MLDIHSNSSLHYLASGLSQQFFPILSYIPQFLNILRHLTNPVIQPSYINTFKLMHEPYWQPKHSNSAPLRCTPKQVGGPNINTKYLLFVLVKIWENNLMESFRYCSTGFPSLFSQIFSLFMTNKRYFVFWIDSHSKNFREDNSRKLLNHWLLGTEEAADWKAV